ncbi:Ltp family lipoprotein, partial [Latilactobacillus sakei]|uniref:Ltp family lipoprotein n=1 Tax=Latilactobacillus sakei TaxID=1599 RepID=UPI0009788892
MSQENNKSIYKPVWFWFFTVILIVVIGSSLKENDTKSAGSKKTESSNVTNTSSSNDDDDTDNDNYNTSDNDDYDTSDDTDSEDTNSLFVKSVPTEYKSALNKANSYANGMNMSKQAVHDQLVSEAGEQFSEEAANYAMENVEADWEENALAKAKSYQDDMDTVSYTHL